MILYITCERLGKYEIIKNTPELHKSNLYKNQVGRKFVFYEHNKKLCQIFYYCDDKLHNEHGPAYIEYPGNETLEKKEYFIKGQIQ
jgi:hypothetical protein